MHSELIKSSSVPSGSKLGLAAGLLASAAMLQAFAAANPVVTVYVDKTAPSGGDGSSWQKAYRDIQDAFNNLGSKIAGVTPPPDCTIKVAQGEYKPDRGSGDKVRQYSLYFTVASAASVSLIGSFAGLQGASPDSRDPLGQSTIVSGDLAGNDGPGFTNRSDNSQRLLAIYASGARITIDGLTLRGAYNPDYPALLSAVPIPSLGALTLSSMSDGRPYASATTIRLVNCTLEENLGYYVGAAATISGDQIAISDSIFRNNSTPYGRGAALRLNPETTADRFVTIQRSKFFSNSADSGGAVSSSSFCSIDRSIFDSNRTFRGGGALTTTALWTLTSCLFSRNSGYDAGAIYSQRPTYDGQSNELTFCTFAHNKGSFGALQCTSARLKSRHCLYWGNQGTDGTVGIFNGSSYFWSTLVQGGKPSIVVSPGSPAFIDSTISADPLFVRPASSPLDTTPFSQLNYRLRTTSPAIAVDSNEGPLRDLDGNVAPWLLRSGADIGAYFNTTETCLINLSGDFQGVVNGSDFALFAIAYDLMLIPDGANPSADFNRDGIINDADFSIFAVAYDRGTCP